MENISLNKGKRGRPIKLDGFYEELAQLQRVCPSVKTKRGLYNRYYTLIALYGVIYDRGKLRKPEYAFLVKEKGMNWEGKKTILAEVGRACEKYPREDVIYGVDEICKHKMNTTMAINYIRSCRGFQQNKITNTVAKLITVLNSSYLTRDEVDEVVERLVIHMKSIDL